MATRDYIHLGDTTGKKQSTVVISGKDEADKPGVLDLQYVTGATATPHYIWSTSSAAFRHGTSWPSTPDSDGAAFGGVTTLDEAFDGGTLIDNSTATGDGNAFSVGDSGTDEKVEIYHSGTHGYINSRTGDLYLAAVGGDIDFSSDNIKSIGTVTCGAVNGLTIDGITSNEIVLTQGNAVVTLAAGTTDLALGAGANVDFAASGTYNFVGNVDVASGKTVDIDGGLNIDNDTVIQGDFTVTATCTINQSLSTTDDPTFAALTVTSITDGTATLTSGDWTAIDTLTTTGQVTIGGDSVKLRFGATPSSDSYILHTAGGDLTFYDPTAGVKTLSQLATTTPLDPIVTGDLTISDGQFDWANSSTSDVNTWQFSNTTANCIDITTDSTTHDVITITDDDITTGSFILLDTDQTTGAFHFIECLQGSTADAFTVSLHGATVIAGTAGGTAALTCSKGDIVLTDGLLSIGADSDLSSKVARNITGASSALFELETTHTGDTGAALLIDTKRTVGAACSIDIDSTATTQTAGVVDMDLGITTGVGIHMTADALTSGSLAHFYTNSTSTTGRNLVTIESSNAAATTEVALFIDQDGTASAQAIKIDSESDTATAGIIDMDLALTTGFGLHMDLGTALTDGGAIYITTNAGDTSTRNLVEIINDNAASTGTQVVKLQQDADEACLYIDHNHSNIAIGVDADPISTATSDVYGIKLSVDHGGTSSGDAYGLYVDDITSVSGNSYAIFTKGTGDVVINSDGDDADFKVSSLNMGYALYVDGTNDVVQINSSAVTTGLLNITVDSGDNLVGLYIDQNDVDDDAVQIETVGTGYGLKMTTGSATGKGAHFIAASSQTTSNVVIDGLTNDWDGADDVGMLHIKQNAALNDVGASLLYVTSSAVKDGAEGNLARFIDTSGSGSGATEYAVEIASTNNEALHVSSGISTFAARIDCTGGIDINADSVDLVIGAGNEFTATNTGTATKFVLTGDLTIGDTTPTNYTKFTSGTGAITFAGTARPTRSFWIAGVDMAVHSGGPATVTAVGGGVGMAFIKSADESVGGAFRLPYDYVTGTNLTMTMYYCANDANAGRKTYWEFDTVPLVEDEDCSGAGANNTFNDALVSSVAYDLNITAAQTITGSGWVAGDLILYNLLRDGNHTQDNVDEDAIVFGLYFTYTAGSV